MGFIRTEYNKKYFNNSLFKSFSCSQRNRNRLKEILSRKKGGELFVLGYGDGGLLRLLSSCFEVYGIDISEYAFKSLHHVFGERISLGDVTNFNMKKNTYEVITGFNILEHIKSPEIVLKKIFDSLKEKGIFIGSVPNNSYILGRLFTFLVNRLDRTHVSTYGPAIWKRLFRETGFMDPLFFGEFILTANKSFYIRSSYWKGFSHNMIFIARK